MSTMNCSELLTHSNSTDGVIENETQNGTKRIETLHLYIALGFQFVVYWSLFFQIPEKLQGLVWWWKNLI